MARKLYVMQETRHARVAGDMRTLYSYMLHEMTPAEFKLALAEATPDVRFTVRPWQAAHRYVQDGGVHMTGLYTDIDGRIRYAQGDPCA